VRAIFGLGNPGLRYQRNRHNAGFLILDSFAESNSIRFKAAKGDYYFAKGELRRTDYYLIKPTTYVNKSGLAVLQFLENYKIDLEDFLVVCDDINLDTGILRVRSSGGDGGHNGLASIIFHLNSDQFPRLRIGIGKSFEEGNLSSFVLTDFTEEEGSLLVEAFKNSNYLIEAFIAGGIKKMLNANSKLFKESSSAKFN